MNGWCGESRTGYENATSNNKECIAITPATGRLSEYSGRMLTPIWIVWLANVFFIAFVILMILRILVKSNKISTSHGVLRYP